MRSATAPSRTPGTASALKRRRGLGIGDRSFQYAGNGIDLKSMSELEYDETMTTGTLIDGAAGKRASAVSNSGAVLVRSVSYKILGKLYADPRRRTSETYMDVHLGQGDEIGDRSFQYAGNGIDLKSMSELEYDETMTTGTLIDGAAGKRASAVSNSGAVLVRSVSYKILGKLYADPRRKTSETYMDVHLGQGDEIGDRSFQYAGNGIDLKSMSELEYDETMTTGTLIDGAAGKRASAVSNSGAVLVRSVSYKILGKLYADPRRKTSETYMDVHLGQGDEIGDRSFQYAGNGIDLKSMSELEYDETMTTGTLIDGAAGKRASAVSNSGAALVRSVSYKILGKLYADPRRKTSETYMDVHLGQGDEIGDPPLPHPGHGHHLKKKTGGW